MLLMAKKVFCRMLHHPPPGIGFFYQHTISMHLLIVLFLGLYTRFNYLKYDSFFSVQNSQARESSLLRRS